VKKFSLKRSKHASQILKWIELSGLSRAVQKELRNKKESICGADQERSINEVMGIQRNQRIEINKN